MTVSYTKPTANPIQDSAGNDAASLTDEPVANSSAVNATGKPGISGGPRVGEELTAEKGTIADANGLTKADAGDTGYAYEYQWIRVDGGTETDISGATAKTYTPTADDQGKKLKVRVSFKDDADTAEALVSDAVPDTGSILPMAACEAPAYTGGAVEVWSAALTIGNSPQDANRFGFSAESSSSYGTLTPEDEFTLGSTDYTIEAATQLAAGSQALSYNFIVDPELPVADIRRLVLHDCDTSRALPTPVSDDTDGSFGWSLTRSDAADWSTFTTRTLRLSYDDVAPTVQSHDLDGASLTLVFSEALDEGSVPAASAFGVKVVGEDATEHVARLNRVSIDGRTVTLTLATAPEDTAAVTLQYTPPSANPLRDPRSNEVEAFGPEEVGYEGPRVVFAKVVGATLTIGYNEALDSGSRPGTARFAVTVDGTPGTVSNVAISGSDVTLTLASAVTRGQPVQLAYTVPTNNPLRDTDGNEARDIAEREVDNDTLSAPGAPRNLRAAAGNTEVTLTWAPPADNGGTPITGYDVRWAGNATAVPSATSWRSVGPGLRYVVTGLVNDRPYAFEVSAVSAEGRGEAGRRHGHAHRGGPDAAGALSSARVENGTLDLTYNEPLDANAVPAAERVLGPAGRVRV